MGLVRTLENWIPAPESFLASPTHAARLAPRAAPGHAGQRARERVSVSRLSAHRARRGGAARDYASARTPPRSRSFTRSIALAGVLALGGSAARACGRFVYWLPGLNFIRIPSRFFLLGGVGRRGAGGDWLRPWAATTSAATRRIVAVATAGAAGRGVS